MIINFIIKSAIYATIFLVPLAYAPWTFEKFEFNKQYALFFLVLLGLAAWFFKMVFQEKELRFFKTSLTKWIGIFLAIGALSSIFSADRWTSFYGLVEIASGAGFYFLIVHHISAKQVSSVLKAFMLSSSIGAVVAYASLLGMVHKNFNLVSSSANGYAVFLAFCAVLVASLPVRAWQFVALLLFLGLLAVINFFGAWMVLVIGLLCALVFSIMQGAQKQERLSIKRVGVLVCVLFLSFVFLFSQARTYQTAISNQTVSWGAGFTNAMSGLKNAAFGSGPGTFQSANYFSELLAEEGLLGLLFFCVLIAAFLLARARNKFSFSAMASLTAAFFAYTQNMTLLVAFWMILGLGMARVSGQTEEIRISLRKYGEIALVARAFLFLMLIIFAFFFFFGVKFYIADMNYAKKSLSAMVNATRLNPYRAEYYMGVSEFYNQEILSELKKNQNDQNKNLISEDAKGAIAFGRQAVARAPLRAEFWETLGFMYENLSFANGATDWAMQSFAKAETLDPSNANIYNELGKLYLGKADLENAKEQLDKAIALNPNFTDALIQEALLLEKRGNTELAISRMKDLRIRYPFHAGIMFQLGRLYFNANKVVEAILEFKAALLADPANSNAHFALATAYEKQGEKKLALQEFKKVLELNPENKDVAGKLKKL